MKDWLLKNANPVDKEDQQRHDKWLCMMYPRLKLLYELLADDGVIFVSIDDNEVHHLRAIMDEIFGEENFVANVVWKTRANPISMSKNISYIHENIIIFSKKILQLFLNDLPRNELQSSRYSNPDKDPRGIWSSDNLTAGPENLDKIYEVITPSGKSVFPSKGLSWIFSKVRFEEMVKDNRITFGKDGNNFPRLKRFLSETREGIVPTTFWDFSEFGGGQRATKDMKEIFENEKVFDFPKPIELIKKLLKLATNQSSIILDSFAGSGTTAHAVLDLNKEDGGNRKFILVEMEDYANNITAERVRRVINGVPTAKDEKLKQGLGGSFTFCKLGDEFNIEKILTGETLPKYEALANYVFYTATGKSLEMPAKQRIDYFVGETDLYEVYLIYQPDIAFLRSNESALNAKMVKIISARESKKQKLVFASAKYMGQNELNDHKIIF